MQMMTARAGNKDYIIERQDLTCPKCCTIIQIVDSTTNGQIFYKKQKEKSISEERMGISYG